MQQKSARPALLVVTVFALSWLECDGEVGAAHAKLGRSANQVAVRTVQRKTALVGDGLAVRETSPRGISKPSVRRLPAVRRGERVSLVKSQQAARRKKPVRTASNVKSSKRQIATFGLASFYAEDRETASGEIFDKHQLNAAHPSLPFGTRLRVTNVKNGRSVTVRVNDRGPFVGGRIIDVTAAAAEALGMIDAGLAKVTLDVVR